MSAPQPPAEEPSEARIANELHRRFCSDVPNDGTYTLALNETETIRFFKEMERLVSGALAGRDALIVQMREALEELRDVQNGPPLVAWEADWNKAINKVAAVLALVPESLAKAKISELEKAK